MNDERCDRDRVTAIQEKGVSVYDEVRAERGRAHAKHGETSMESANPLDPQGVRRDIIMEEVGEISREYNDARHERRPVNLWALRKELIQLAAMAVAWAEALGTPDE